MLERVPAAAESTAQVFLRSVEYPIRSSRVLDRRFWRHGAEKIDSSKSSTWWPAYLQQVRSVPSPGPVSCDYLSVLNTRSVTHCDVKPRGPQCGRDAATCTLVKLHPAREAHASRSYSVSTQSQHNAGVKEADLPAEHHQSTYHDERFVSGHVTKDHIVSGRRAQKKERSSVKRSFVESDSQPRPSSVRTSQRQTEPGNGLPQAATAYGLTEDAAVDPFSSQSMTATAHLSGADARQGLPNPSSLSRTQTSTTGRLDVTLDTHETIDQLSLDNTVSVPRMRHLSATQRRIGDSEVKSRSRPAHSNHESLSEAHGQGKKTSEPSPGAMSSSYPFKISPSIDEFHGWEHDNPLSSLVPTETADAAEPEDFQPFGKDAEQTKRISLLDKSVQPATQSATHTTNPDVTQQRDVLVQVEGSEVVDPKRKRLDMLMRTGARATTDQFDEVWSLFLSLDDQERLSPYVFRFLTRSNDSKHFSRALAAFNIIPRPRRTEAMYQAAMNIELKRYQHGNAMNLAFEANSRHFNIVPKLLAYLVDKMLWNSAAELLHRNTSARRDFAAFAADANQLDASEPQMLSIDDLIGDCLNVPDLPSKTLALSERIWSQDAALIEHPDLLRALCQQLALRSVQSPAAMRSITPQALLSTLSLEENLGWLNLHHEALNTISDLTGRNDRLDLALLVYRNFKFRYPDIKSNDQIVKALILLCEDAEDCPTSLYDYLFAQFSKRPSAFIIHKLMTFCARQGDSNAVERYLKIWNSLHGSHKWAGKFNPLIQAHAVTGDVRGATEAFDQLKTKHQVEPDTVSWNMLMLAHVRSDDDTSAFGIWEEMQQKRVAPNEFTFGQLLAVCAAHGDTESALDILVDARKHGATITITMINTVVEAYLKNDDPSAAFRFAQTTANVGNKKELTRLWNSFIRYFAYKGRLPELLKTRKLMADYHVAADEMTYASIMTVMISQRRTSEAFQLLQDMHRKEGIAITKVHYSILLHGFVAEANRDMATVVYNEAKQRYPDATSDIDAAISALNPPQGTRPGSLEGSKNRSLRFLALAEYLWAQSKSTGTSRDSQHTTSPRHNDLSSVCYETVVRALIRLRSFESAEQLSKQVEHLSQETASTRSVPSRQALLAQLEIALNRENWLEFDKIWQSAFDRELKATSSIPRKSSKGEDNAKRASRLVASSSIRFGLERHLGMYMEAMARQNRQQEMRDFFHNKLWSSGFEFTGRNWNKHIQVLCRSRNPKDHVTAFSSFEKRMRVRAQSWDLLRRGKMRKKLTTYLWEPYGQLRRPILQKQNRYRTVERAEEMRDPARRIPTYLTTVHLAAVLIGARDRASRGSPRLLDSIKVLAPRTKRFIQYMPLVNDDVQGPLLRQLPIKDRQQRRPRSEPRSRKSTTHKGSTGKSQLDQIPLDFLEDIEQIAGRGNDVRRLLKDSKENDNDIYRGRTDVEVGELLTGQISRAPIVLAGKGRLENQAELERRIDREEREKHEFVQKLRAEVTARQLSGKLTTAPLNVRAHPDVHNKEPSADTRGDEEQAILQRESAFVYKGLSDHARAPDEARSSQTASLPSVSQQLHDLSERRERGLQHNRAHQHRRLKIPELAIPYANTRRLRRRLALRQRVQARRLLTELRNNLSTKAFEIRSAAGKQLQKFERAQERRATVLAYERDLKAGRRLDPFPKVHRGLRSHEMFHGAARVRFVTDLGRKSKNYMVRRGRLFDRRQRRVQTSPSKYVKVPVGVVERAEMERQENMGGERIEY